MSLVLDMLNMSCLQTSKEKLLGESCICGSDVHEKVNGVEIVLDWPKCLGFFFCQMALVALPYL